MIFGVGGLDLHDGLSEGLFNFPYNSIKFLNLLLIAITKRIVSFASNFIKIFLF